MCHMTGLPMSVYTDMEVVSHLLKGFMSATVKTQEEQLEQKPE